MKQLLLSIFMILLAAGLVACGGNTNVEDSGDGTNGAEEGAPPPAEENGEGTANDGFSKDIGEVIVDNDNIQATLIRVEKIVDEEWDEERVEVTFEVENKRDDTIEVQARSVSADGKMVDEGMLSMSQEVAPGKLADAVLTIQNYEGDLPSMEDNIEMQLHIFSWDNMDYTEDHPVTIDMK